MRYVSTRGQAPELGFDEAMLAGLASDGGLYVPAEFPQMPEERIASLAGLPYEDAACAVMEPFVGDSFSGAELREMAGRAYESFDHVARAPLRQLDAGHFLLELFHGPTLAFKDLAMQMVARLFEASLARRGGRVAILGATSGDTGAAAMEAFGGLANVDVFILYPEGRVSEIQRLQMTTAAAGNVRALAVEGTFDDCQARVKDLFNDAAFRESVSLAGVNSINWARVLAQVVYFFTSAAALGAPRRKVSFAVPTGNFGDVFAGYVARSMGLPVDRLVVATNRNDILHRCLSGEGYRKGDVLPTLSPSMDIQVSSNFERALYFAHGRDSGAITRLMAELGDGGFEVGPDALASLRESYDSGRASEEETAAAIAEWRARTGEAPCPHTAVGLKVAEEMRDPQVPMITLATAHPAKFPEAMAAAGLDGPGDVPAPPRLAGLRDLPEREYRVENDPEAIKAHVAGAVGAGAPA